MSIHSIGLFKGLMSKMDYLTARQEVLSKNIANADTPGYKASDLEKVDFTRVVAASNKRSSAVVAPMRTHSHHMSLKGVAGDPVARKSKDMYEVSPTLNSVVIEEQMVKANKNASDYQIMSTVYRRNLAMVRMALGTGGRG